MGGRPEDVSQEAWDKAYGQVEELTLSMHPDEFLECCEVIARVIMAAKGEEREACALLIDEGFDRPGINTKQDMCTHQRFGWEDCEQCASAAIRSRAALRNHEEGQPADR